MALLWSRYGYEYSDIRGQKCSNLEGDVQRLEQCVVWIWLEIRNVLYWSPKVWPNCAASSWSASALYLPAPPRAQFWNSWTLGYLAGYAHECVSILQHSPKSGGRLVGPALALVRPLKSEDENYKSSSGITDSKSNASSSKGKRQYVWRMQIGQCQNWTRTWCCASRACAASSPHAAAPSIRGKSSWSRRGPWVETI